MGWKFFKCFGLVVLGMSTITESQKPKNGPPLKKTPNGLTDVLFQEAPMCLLEKRREPIRLRSFRWAHTKQSRSNFLISVWLAQIVIHLSHDLAGDGICNTICCLARFQREHLVIEALDHTFDFGLGAAAGAVLTHQGMDLVRSSASRRPSMEKFSVAVSSL